MKKVFTLLTKTLLVAVCLLGGASSAWATEVTPSLSGWTSNVGTGGSVTTDEATPPVTTFTCGSTKGNAISLTSTTSYTNISKIELDLKTSDRSKMDVKIEIGTLVESVFTPVDGGTFTSTYDGDSKKLTLGTIQVANNSDYYSGYVSPANKTGYVRITIAQGSNSNNKIGYVKNLKITYTGAPTITTDLPATADVKVNVAHEFSITATGATSYQWYTCEDEEKKNPVAIDGATSATLTYTATGVGTEYIYCVATNAAGSTPSTVCAVTATNGPTITQQPVSANYVTGDTPIALHVTATASEGGGDLSYQWYRCDDINKSNPSETGGSYGKVASYSPSTAAAGTFYYYCLVTDGNGSTASNVATITVTAATAPTISVSGAPVGDIIKGTAVTLTATVTGVPAPTIKWFSNTTASTSGGTFITGETNETFSPSTATPGTYYYFAQVDNGVGNALSAVQTIVVKDKSELVAISGEKTWTIPTSLTLELKDDGTTAPAKYDEYYTYSDIATINGNDLGTFDGTTLAFSGQYPYRGSNGSQNGNLQFKTTVPGNVTVEFSNTGGSNKERWVKVNETTGTVEADGTTHRNETFAVGAGTITITHVDKNGNLSPGLRIYSIIFTPTSVPVSTKADRNYASYVTTQKLDFGSAEGITAYIATGLNSGETAVEMTPVNVVPAGTPIIVKTNTQGATVNVPVTTANADDVSGNKLVAGDGTTVANSDYYYLANDLFHLATSGTLQSGKAYLKVAGSPTAPSLNLGFDDATGIESIAKSQELTANGQYYNLAGQRVAQPTKGLYIVNGRKVIIK